MSITKSTITTYEYSASTRELVIPFDYLRRDFIFVILSGNGQPQKTLIINVDYKFSTKTTITMLRQFNTDEGFDKVTIRRITDASKRIVNFQDGSVLNALDLNISQIQALHVAEEARDLSSYGLVVNDEGFLDARGRRIINLGAPIKGTDAADFKSIETLNPMNGIRTIESIDELRNTEPKTHGELIYVKSYHRDAGVGGGYFKHDATVVNGKDNGITSFTTDLGNKTWVRGYDTLSVFDCGCLIGVDSTQYVANMEASGLHIDGLGAAILVNKVMKPADTLSNVAYVYNGIKYISKDYLEMRYSQVTKTGYYSCWTQDKTFAHNGVLYCPFMIAFGHKYDDLRIVMVRSFDNGETWDTPQILLDYHPQNPTNGYHSFSMGVVNGRMFMLIEERRVSDSKLINVNCYSKPLTYSRRLTGGLYQTGSKATVKMPEHGLFVGDYVYFSRTTMTGLSGRVKVSGVPDPDTLEFTLSNSAEVDNKQVTWDFGVSFEGNTWKKQSLGSFNVLSTTVTHIHSFTTISEKKFIVGAHWGDSNPRKLGIIEFTINWTGGSVTPIMRLFSDEISRFKGEPCVRYYNGKLYVSTRTQNSSEPPLFIESNTDLTDVKSFAITNKAATFTPLPFQIINDKVYMFGTERGEGEWETGEFSETRWVTNYPRTMLITFDLKDFGRTDKVTTTCIYQGIQKGESGATANGVGSVIYKEGYLYYLFADEDYRHSHSIMENAQRANNPCVDDGFQPEINCIKLKIGNINKVGDSYPRPLTGVDNVTFPVLRDPNGYRIVQCNVKFDNYIESKAITSNVFIASSSSSSSGNKYGLFGTDYNKDVTRVYLSSSNKASKTNGAIITLHNDKSTTPSQAVLDADKAYILTNDTYIKHFKGRAPARTLTMENTGDFTFTYISDTQIKITMRGADGVNRALIMSLT